MTQQSTVNKDDAKKFANLIGPMDSRVDREAREKMITARVGMLLRASFFGNLATRLRLVNADEWLATAATDGRHFYYNSRFVNMLKPRELEFLFGHEVLHVVYDHFGRRGDRDPKLWNIANDFCVNADLKKHRVGEFITTVPCLYDNKYDGMSSEEVYDDLYENAEKISLDDLIDKLLDEHMDGDDQDSAGDGDGQDGKGPVRMSKEERERLRDEVKEAVLNAAQSCDNAGQIPAGVKRMISAMTEPRMNWRELIQTELKSTIKDDYTWMRPSRRNWHHDAVMPGMDNDFMIDIAVAIDMSGSIGEQQGRDFVSEVAGIMSEFGQYRIHLFCFDTDVYGVEVFTSENLKDIDQYELRGGGGTDFDCIFAHLRNEDIVPNKLVVFTDGYPCGSWGDDNYCDTVWIIHGDRDPHPPFGTWAVYDDHRTGRH
jgi:predicted metal-dependent peptidase